MNNDPYISSPGNLISFLESKKICSFLIGNGYCLSHPVFGNAFKWDLSSALNKDSILPPESRNCPEKDLGWARHQLVSQTIKYYIRCICGDSCQSLLREAYSQYKENQYKPLSLFNYCRGHNVNIFTINYDPLLYFEILGLRDRFDGFISGKDNNKDGCLSKYNNESDAGFKQQEYYACKLENKKNGQKIYYLHGAWFILENKQDQLKKINIDESIGIENIFEKDKCPFFILEDRWYIKKSLIEISSYWKCCADALMNTNGSLFVLGVSFANDEHIIEYLSKSKFDHIFICYLLEPPDIAEKCGVIGIDPAELEKKIIYVKIDQNVIWESTT
ncbi:MAG: DUF4917 family protein [Gammaproteobacteria bacterium]